MYVCPQVQLTLLDLRSLHLNLDEGLELRLLGRGQARDVLLGDVEFNVVHFDIVLFFDQESEAEEATWR